MNAKATKMVIVAGPEHRKSSLPHLLHQLHPSLFLTLACAYATLLDSHLLAVTVSKASSMRPSAQTILDVLVALPKTSKREEGGGQWRGNILYLTAVVLRPAFPPPLVVVLHHAALRPLLPTVVSAALRPAPPCATPRPAPAPG